MIFREPLKGLLNTTKMEIHHNGILADQNSHSLKLPTRSLNQYSMQDVEQVILQFFLLHVDLRLLELILLKMLS